VRYDLPWLSYSPPQSARSSLCWPDSMPGHGRTLMTVRTRRDVHRPRVEGAADLPVLCAQRTMEAIFDQPRRRVPDV
jgi:hypothetical protein